MATYTFNNVEYTKKSLSTLGGKAVVELFNTLAKTAGKPLTKRFSSIGAGIERTWALLQEVGTAPPAAAPVVKEPIASMGAPVKDRSKTSDKGPTLRTRRGTNLLPPGHAPLPCREGSKQARLLDLLVKGATMPELIKALSGGNKPWTEATVRSGFGWDMKQKGYGVRSEFDPDGTERFLLVIPTGKSIPEHTLLKGKPTPKLGR